MAKGGGGSETVEQTTEPWEGQKPYLTDVMGEARRIYDQGYGQQFAPFSTVVPYHGATLQGLNQTRDLAQQGNPFVQPSGQALQNILRGGTSFGNRFANNPGGDPTTQPMADVASGQQSLPVDQRMLSGRTGRQNLGLNTMAAGALGGIQNQRLGSLSQMAQYHQGNPYLDEMVENAGDSIRNQVGSLFSASGRYGSTAHQGTLADKIGEMAAGFYGNQYNTDMNRRLQASQALAGFGESAAQRQLASASGLQGAELQNRQLGLSQARSLSDVLNQNIQNRLRASRGLQQYDLGRTGQQLGALGMAPQVRQMQFDDAARLGQVGTAFENKAAQELQDRLQRFRFSQQAPWDALGRYSGVVSGMGSLGGTMTQTGPQQSQNPLMGALGGFSTAAGGLGALGQLGGAAGALATGPAAPFILGAGALGGLFS